MDYFLKANGLIILLWLFYYVCLRNETFFSSIRMYFLLGLLIIISIPLIEIPIYVENTISDMNWNIIDASIMNEVSTERGFDWFQFLPFLYLAGVVFFSSKFIIQLFSLGKLLAKHKITKRHKYKLIETNENISPFSFFKYIIYNKNQFTPDELNQIISHEETHAKQWHSIDTLLTYVLQIVFWFNPFAWLYKKEVEQNLELLVDSHILKSSKSQKSYQKLLLKTSIPNYQMALANNFFNSFLKKRINMIHSEKSNRKSQWKFLLIIPLLMVFIFALNTKTIAQEKEDNNSFKVKKVEIHAMVFTKKSSKSNLDKISNSFAKKGLSIKFKGIKRNKDSEITAIKIDAQADNGKTSASYAADDDEGINPVKISFDSKNNSLSIGSSDGKHMNGYAFSKKGKTEIIRQKGKGKSYVFISDDDETNANSSTNIWVTKDGDTAKVRTKKMTIEIDQNEEGDSEETYEVIIDENDDETKGKFKIRAMSTGTGEQPIFILNGKEISKEKMDKIDTNNIESMHVLKGKKAEEKYGDKGKNGVIEITTGKE